MDQRLRAADRARTLRGNGSTYDEIVATLKKEGMKNTVGKNHTVGSIPDLLEYTGKGKRRRKKKGTRKAAAVKTTGLNVLQAVKLIRNSDLAPETKEAVTDLLLELT